MTHLVEGKELQYSLTPMIYMCACLFVYHTESMYIVFFMLFDVYEYFKICYRKLHTNTHTHTYAIVQSLGQARWRTVVIAFWYISVRLSLLLSHFTKKLFQQHSLERAMHCWDSQDQNMWSSPIKVSIWTFRFWWHDMEIYSSCGPPRTSLVNTSPLAY